MPSSFRSKVSSLGSWHSDALDTYLTTTSTWAATSVDRLLTEQLPPYDPIRRRSPVTCEQQVLLYPSGSALVPPREW